MAAGLWPFGDVKKAKAQPLSIWGFVADCLTQSRAVLAEAGLCSGQEPFSQGELDDLGRKVEAGSREEVALSLWTMAWNARPALSLLRTTRHPDQMGEYVAGLFVNLGMTRTIFDSMAPTGVADAAQAGRAVPQRARAAADARHSQPGGARERQRAIREIWASGKYTSRDLCAEEEGRALGMSFSAARKALRNTPNPA